MKTEDYEYLAFYDLNKVRKFDSPESAENFMHDMAELGHDVEVYAKSNDGTKLFLIGKRQAVHKLQEEEKIIVVDLDCNDIPIRVNNLKELQEEVQGYFLHEFRGSEEEMPRTLRDCIEFLKCNGFLIFWTGDRINDKLVE